jgi:uncharacterized SAM-binding protein YcdF (DUF218 family)
MNIPKYPEVPNLNEDDILHITKKVFIKSDDILTSDALLIFGGSHPGLWITAIDLYKRGISKKIFVTGGNKESAHKHSSWTYGVTPEADVIKGKLIENNVNEEDICIENTSTNSYENVLLIKDQILQNDVKSLICICKNYGSGRQYRTISKYLPNIKISMKTFETNVDENGNITEDNWWKNDKWKSLVWGEYLRIMYYGWKGQIVFDIRPTINIEKYINEYYKMLP